jgi:DNA-directed RNA polymerase subunit beta'
MIRSGARGSREQVRQLAGMRGLISRPSGEVVETPIKSSFREGLSVLEFFRSTHGARKGLADTALKTAEAGYLTRKLADVAQNVVVTMHDCGTTEGVGKSAVERMGRVEQTLAEAIRGRVLLAPVLHPVTGELLAAKSEPISREQAAAIEAAGIERVTIRSPMTCAAPLGVCQLCYGVDLTTGALVEQGMAVGIIAAQSIGEPGTQLTMQTFHIGGVHTGDDITRGLPRVIELFEARGPGKGAGRPAAVLAEVAGRVRLGGPAERKHGRPLVFVQPVDEDGHRCGREVPHRLPPGAVMVVEEGAVVTVGQPLTAGGPLPKDLLRLCGEETVRDYLLREVQAVYRAQGVVLDDRHIEVILARMLRRVRVVSAGDTTLLPGALVDRQVFAVNARLEGCVRIKDPGDSGFRQGQVVTREELAAARRRLKAEGGELPLTGRTRPAVGVPMLQGISRAAVQSESFISAASFQETTRVLADAALAGKVDRLVGLKENVIAGRLVPAGTGFPAYQELRIGLDAPALEAAQTGGLA